MATMDSAWGSTHLKRNETYSTQIKEAFEDQTFAQGMVRFINDFGDGDNFKVSSIGELAIDQMSESVALPERRPDTGQFVFNINEFVGVKVPFTDKFLEDDFLAPAAIASMPRKMKRAFDEYMETQTLKLHQVQTNANANTINGAAHRLGASGSAGQMLVEDFAYARYAMQKGKVPLTGLVAVVDPSFEFNTNINSSASGVVDNPRWGAGMGFDPASTDGVRFLNNIFGWDVYVSDYLDVATATESLNEYDGSTAANVAVGDVYNLFMCLADDDAKPFMGAWRRTPTIKSWRDEDIETEYHQLSARFGLNLWRPESLVTIASTTALT